jgi:hypothetical protein
MNSRIRHVAALFALIALTIGTVQGLWASTCLMEMPVATTASTEAAAPSGVCTHGMSAISDGISPSQDDGGTGAPHCPFMPMGVAGSCGAVMAFPAGSSLSLEPSSPEALLPRFPNEARDLLLAAAFFRPPIA